MINTIKIVINTIVKYIQITYYNLINLNNSNRKNKILFLESHSLKLSFNFKEMYSYLEEKGYELEFGSAEILEDKSWFGYRLHDFKMMHVIKRNQFIFLNDGYELLNRINLKEDQKLIQLWHASGIFKKFGYSTQDKEYGKNTNFDWFPIHKNYDLVSVSSEYVVPFYEEAMNTSGNVKALGSSRSDYYFKEENKIDAQNKFEEFVKSDKKVLLYAPTFRGRLNTDQNYPLDVSKLKEELGDDYILVYKFHPFIKSHNLDVDNEFSFDLSKQMEFHELAFIADICITDYSSIVFDWSLVNKPIGFYLYDIEDYINNRGFYEELNAFIPGPQFTYTSEIIDWIKKDNFENPELINFKNKYMGACDGSSSEKIASHFGL